MIEPEKRKAIFILHEEAMSSREISRRLNVSRNTVDEIIKQKGNIPNCIRKSKIKIEADLIRRLYSECGGWIQRIHEKLVEEQGVSLGYSTLTRTIRDLGLGKTKNKRCDRVPDKVGEEMQQDTSPYVLKLGDRKLRVQGSILYYRYSKIRYLKFYRSFNRYTMKCFFHEALTFWGYAAPKCIIDNTNLARLRGTGKNALIVPEMEQFAKQYGFEFICHAIKHPNRKAGNERSFFTVETNFFPGREFESLEDLNKQALQWATVRIPNRPMSKSRLIPAKAFEFEKAYLIKVLPLIHPPYLVFERRADQYGYISFAANFYWVPGTKRFEVRVLRYSHCIKIYLKRQLLIEYPLPPDGSKNMLYSPPGKPESVYKPNNRKKPTEQEEKRLRAVSKEVDDYLVFLLKNKGTQKHKLIRELYGLYQKLVLPLFIKTVKRALRYRVKDMNSVKRIALLQIRDGDYQMPSEETSNEYQNRESYKDGSMSDDTDLSIYDKLLEDEDE